jgi:hypothetical protein
VCILCGEFVTQLHWTDRENKADASGPTGNPGKRYRSWRRERSRRAVVANEVLRHYGLKVQDWNGSSYLVRDGKGRSALVRDLGSLWPAAQKLANRPLDPLDTGLHAALGAASTDKPANGG